MPLSAGVASHDAEASTTSLLPGPSLYNDPSVEESTSYVSDAEQASPEESRPVSPITAPIADASVDALGALNPEDLLLGILDAGAGLLDTLSAEAVTRLVEAEGGGNLVRRKLQSMEIAERSSAVHALSKGFFEM